VGPKCYYGEAYKQGPRISPTSEITRLVHVWASPEMRSHLSQHLQGDSRPAMDAGDGRQTFWMHISRALTTRRQRSNPLWTSIRTLGRGGASWTAGCCTTDAEFLKLQWNVKNVTEYFGNWTKSGQMDPSNFWDFCKGDRVAYYTLKVLMVNNLLYAVTKTVPPDEGFDAGIQHEPGVGDGVDGGMCAPASGAQGVKRMKASRGAGKRKSGGTSSSNATRDDTSATPQNVPL